MRPYSRFVLALLLVVAGCAEATDLSFRVRRGVETLTVLDATAGGSYTLENAQGRRLITLIADEFGQAHFAYIPETYTVLKTGAKATLPTFKGNTLSSATGYRIRFDDSSPPEETDLLFPLDRDNPPPASFYENKPIHEGLNYIEMRDGVKLSATVWFPDNVLYGRPPWPTLITYSGYSPSNPDSPPPGALIGNFLGYAVVGVNMRGSGCSGGVFDIFNPAQHADGYDAVETIARQRFVKYNKVGMIGLSYPGISQLYVASTRPPHLAAIAPMSVIEDPWRQQWPGGVYNGGFTKNWLRGRDESASAGGSSWVQKRIDEGDKTCASHMKLRNQNIDFEQFGRTLKYFPPDAQNRRLGMLVNKIDIPVFLAGGWQDEQTGSRFATMLDDFTGKGVKRFTMYNGQHPDGYTPLILARAFEFFELYISRRIPFVHPVLRTVAPALFEMILGVPGLKFEDDRFLEANNWEDAVRLYEAEDPVHVLFESGYGNDISQAPVARYEASFATWPPPAESWQLFLDGEGTLSASEPQTEGVDSYLDDPDAGAISYIKHDNIFRPVTDWQPAPDGTTLSYLSAPLAQTTVVLGNGGYVDMWFSSEASQANIEVNILEIYPTGDELLVQSGTFNMEHRNGMDKSRSDTFLVEYTYKVEDASALQPGEYYEVKVPIRPFGHVFRAGSRLRLMINTPGRESPFWEYENPLYDSTVRQRVAHTQAMPSHLVLPVVSGVEVPPSYPDCLALRGMVCRAFRPYTNTTE